jgi:hypothetical protein
VLSRSCRYGPLGNFAHARPTGHPELLRSAAGRAGSALLYWHGPHRPGLRFRLGGGVQVLSPYVCGITALMPVQRQSVNFSRPEFLPTARPVRAPDRNRGPRPRTASDRFPMDDDPALHFLRVCAQSLISPGYIRPSRPANLIPLEQKNGDMPRKGHVNAMP